MSRVSITKLTLLLALCVAALVVTGCKDDKHEKQPAKAKAKVTVKAGRVKTPVPDASTEGAKKPADPEAGKTVPLVRKPPSKLPAPLKRKVATLDVRPAKERKAAAEETDTPVDDRSELGYETFIKAVTPLIDQFWKKKMGEFAPGATYSPPAHLVSYDGDGAPGCFGQRSAAMRGNAYYCPSVGPAAQCRTVAPNQGYCLGDDIIAWDRTGLMLPFYQQIGLLATGLVLAHEWGHLIQARTYPNYDYDTVIRRELQADCYAGAWALEMKRQGRVDIGSFNETLDLFETVGGEGDAWLDPDSHGNKFQRIRSFTQGFEEDAGGCVGAKFKTLLSRIGLED